MHSAHDKSCMLLFYSWLFFFGMKCCGWRGPGHYFPDVTDVKEVIDLSRSTDFALDLQLYYSICSCISDDVMRQIRLSEPCLYDYSQDEAIYSNDDIILIMANIEASRTIYPGIPKMLIDTSYNYISRLNQGVNCSMFNQVLRDNIDTINSLRKSVVVNKINESCSLSLLPQVIDPGNQLYPYVPYTVPLDRQVYGAPSEFTLFYDDENDFNQGEDEVDTDEDDDQEFNDIDIP